MDSKDRALPWGEGVDGPGCMGFDGKGTYDMEKVRLLFIMYMPHSYNCFLYHQDKPAVHNQSYNVLWLAWSCAECDWKEGEERKRPGSESVP